LERFKHFVEIHHQAYTNLDELSEPLTKAAKVHKSLKHFKAPSLKSAIVDVEKWF
jgi:hypothetical protein